MDDNNYIIDIDKNRPKSPLETIMEEFKRNGTNRGMWEFIKKLDNGEIKYRLTADTDETARDKVDLRGFEFKFAEDDHSFTDEDLTFNNTSFVNADLTGCKFECNFPGVFFEYCNLSNTNFKDCTFTSSTFLGTDIANSNFDECVFEAQIINNCDMRRSTFNDCGFKADDVMSFGRHFFEIKDTDLSESHWKKCVIQDGEIIETCILQNSDFTGCQFERVRIDDCNLDSIDFYADRSTIEYCIIENSSMEDAKFRDTFLSNSKFIMNFMKNVIFRDNSNILECQFKDSNMDNLQLFSVRIESCYFVNTVLPNSKFEKTVITNSVCKSCDFTGLTLITPIQLRFCNFSSANFSNMKIIKTSDDDEIDVKESTFENAIFNDDVNPADVFLNYNPDFTEAEFNALLNALFNQQEQPRQLIDETKIEVNYEEIPDFTHLSPLSPLEIKEEWRLDVIVKLLTPNIIHVKLPISKMNNYEWYGISELGNTTVEEWKRISGKELDKMPTIGYVFKCISVPEQKEGEAVVYIANPPCMDVHELSRQLNIPRIKELYILL